MPALISRVAFVLASRSHCFRAAAFGWLIAVLTPSAYTARIAPLPLPILIITAEPPAVVLMMNALDARSADEPPPVNLCVLAIKPLPFAKVAPDTFLMPMRLLLVMKDALRLPGDARMSFPTLCLTREIGTPMSRAMVLIASFRADLAARLSDDASTLRMRFAARSDAQAISWPQSSVTLMPAIVRPFRLRLSRSRGCWVAR